MRATPVVFAATVKPSVPLPVRLAVLDSEIQVTFDDGFHRHPVVAVTPKLYVPPPLDTFTDDATDRLPVWKFAIKLYALVTVMDTEAGVPAVNPDQPVKQ